MGPYVVIDAESRKPMRINKFTKLGAAFQYGDLESGNRDYVVLDKTRQPVPRSWGAGTPHTPGLSCE